MTKNKRVLHFRFDFVHTFFGSFVSCFLFPAIFSLWFLKGLLLLLLLLLYFCVNTSTVIVVVFLSFRFPHQSSYAGLADSMVELMEQVESESTNKNQTSISSLFMHRNIFHSQIPYSLVFSSHSPTPYCVHCSVFSLSANFLNAECWMFLGTLFFHSISSFLYKQFISFA